MKRTAFVSGAAGFLGRHLVEALVRRGFEVIALCLPTDPIGPLQQPGVRVVTGDITDLPSLLEAMPSAPEVVFHLAANTSSWSRNDEAQFRTNVGGTANMLEAAAARGAKRFVYTSSITAFGHHPGRRIDETTASNAMTCGINYGKTKYLAEGLVKQAARRGLSTVILNPVNLLGPYDVNSWNKQLIRPAFDGTLRAVPPGKAMWCHVKDAVDAHLAAIERGGVGENYLLGGVEASFKEVINEIERLTGQRPSKHVTPKAVLRLALLAANVRSKLDGKEPFLTRERYLRAVAHISCDSAKAVRELGFKTTPLPVTLEETLRWLREEDLRKFVEVDGEPNHVERFKNDWVRVYLARLTPGMTTLYHRHRENTLYVILHGGVLRTTLLPGHRRLHVPAVGLPKSLGLATKLSWAVRQVALGTVNLPTSALLVQYHRAFPVIHRVHASERNARPMEMLGIEVRPHARGHDGAPLDSTGLALEYADDELLVHRLVLRAGMSTCQRRLRAPSLLVIVSGNAHLGAEPHASASSDLGTGDVRWLDCDESLELANPGDHQLEALLVTII